MLLLCISSPNISPSVLHACQTPLLIQQFLLCYTRCTKEKQLEEQSKHDRCLSVALWGKGMIQKWASCSWHCRAGSDLLWSVGKSVTNAALRVKGRCRGEELSWTGKSEDRWAASVRAGAMAAAVSWDEPWASSLGAVGDSSQPRAVAAVFVWKASGRDKLDILGSLMS